MSWQQGGFYFEKDHIPSPDASHHSSLPSDWRSWSWDWPVSARSLLPDWGWAWWTQQTTLESPSERSIMLFQVSGTDHYGVCSRRSLFQIENCSPPGRWLFILQPGILKKRTRTLLPGNRDQWWENAGDLTMENRKENISRHSLFPWAMTTIRDNNTCKPWKNTG